MHLISRDDGQVRAKAKGKIHATPLSRIRLRSIVGMRGRERWRLVAEYGVVKVTAFGFGCDQKRRWRGGCRGVEGFEVVRSKSEGRIPFQANLKARLNLIRRRWSMNKLR